MEMVCRRLKTIDAISRQKIDIRVGMVPWGRRHWIGINFCHPEVKLQQQCQMQNTILIYVATPQLVLFFFFLGEGECQYILETETGKLEGKMKMTIQ